MLAYLGGHGLKLLAVFHSPMRAQQRGNAGSKVPMVPRFLEGGDAVDGRNST